MIRVGIVENTYQELRVVVLEDLRCLGGRCLSIGGVTSEADSFVVCWHDVSGTVKEPGTIGITVDLDHGVDVHEVDQSDTAFHELNAPPRGCG